MAGSSEPIAPLFSLELDLPPSCLEFCPIFPDYFLVGTYNLQKDETSVQANATEAEESSQGPSKEAQKRNGSIVVYKVEDKSMYVSWPRPFSLL